MVREPAVGDISVNVVLHGKTVVENVAVTMVFVCFWRLDFPMVTYVQRY